MKIIPLTASKFLNGIRTLTKSLFVVLILLTKPLYAEDIFNEKENITPSLDERIKALESAMNVNSSSSKAVKSPAEQVKSNVLGSQPSISEQLHATTLESETQELKSEIIELNKELAILEEELLTPVSSQTALFLSIDKGNFFTLDGLKIKIDGNIVHHHLYTKQEMDALKKGAIQRVYTDNIAPGNHEIIVILSGYSIDGRDIKQAVNYKFYKPTSKKYIELAIVDNIERQNVNFEFKEWQ